jgi:hypothetical protein
LTRTRGVLGWAKYGRLANQAAEDADRLGDEVADELAAIGSAPGVRSAVRTTKVILAA